MSVIVLDLFSLGRLPALFVSQSTACPSPLSVECLSFSSSPLSVDRLFFSSLGRLPYIVCCTAVEVRRNAQTRQALFLVSAAAENQC